MTSKFVFIALTLAATSSSLLADTLVFTNGRRMEGQLIGVYGREIEFETSGFNRRTLRIPRNEIARIEFDNAPEPAADRGGRPAGGPESVFGSPIPRGMRERTVNVTAREPWTDTGIEIRQGQQIYFQASGETRWGPNRRDGAAGERNSPVNPNRPLPDRPAASLIARVGEGNDIFFVGAEPGPFRARSSGRLFLGINDDVWQDNTGALRVTVSY